MHFDEIWDLCGSDFRLNGMPPSTDERRELQQLQAEYRHAWRRFCLDVRRWQALMSDHVRDEIRLKAAENTVSEAELLYRQRRNALAEHLLWHLSAKLGDQYRYIEPASVQPRLHTCAE